MTSVGLQRNNDDNNNNNNIYLLCNKFFSLSLLIVLHTAEQTELSSHSWADVQDCAD
jgi:hypothetical protein